MKKLLIALAVVAVIGLVVKKKSAGRADWHGLTEDEARERLNDRFPDRMPEDKRDAVTDKIVSKMRDKGVIVDLTTSDEPSSADVSADDSTIAEGV